ncbi:cell surface glycoprotein CD200 receptor 1-A-like [Hoplias malabaricus]|uniref:cell surface glycoprotein CD200 receptor 1-A-like n=1 Tax=Hoplias malabaricus TaxID=27720 RepID=UPI003462A24B
MEKKWMLRMVLVLAIYLSGTLTSGPIVTSSLNSNKTTPNSHSAPEKLEGFRNESVEKDKLVTLLCTNTTIPWREMIYVIWKISTPEKNCSIAVAKNDSDHNSCEDGKYINTEEYSLIIPHFSTKDEGTYTCDVSYTGGALLETVHVSVWGPLNLSGWLEVKDGRTIAFCKTQSKAAATSIHWEKPWNSPPEHQLTREASGLHTVTSWIELPQNVSHKSLICVATANHLQNTFKFSDVSTDTYIKWPFILLGVCATCSIVTLLTGLYLMRDKLGQLSVFRRVCCTPQISQAPREEKTPQPRDPEEVEPYASYVQRVNSIYNSSAELINA